MARTKDNVVTHGLSGKIGILVFSQKDDKTFVSRAPRASKKPLTDAQKEVRHRFQQAVIYGKSVLADPAKKAEYDARAAAGKTGYNVALADFLHAPDIEEINVSDYTGGVGSTIIVKATDDFNVSRVRIKIENADGSLVEEGDAVADIIGLTWIYTATVANASVAGDKITVTAYDNPGNTTELSKLI